MTAAAPTHRPRHTHGGQARRVEEILTPLIAQLTVAKRPTADEAAKLWRRLVGPTAAKHSQPTSLRRGELLVVVDTSAWLWNVSLQRPRLLEGLQAAWGSEAVTAIRLRIKPSMRD